MKILFAASELKPFVSSGTMSASVSKMLRSVSKKCEVEAVVPFFSSINRKKYDIKPAGISFEVEVGENARKQKFLKRSTRKAARKSFLSQIRISKGTAFTATRPETIPTIRSVSYSFHAQFSNMRKFRSPTSFTATTGTPRLFRFICVKSTEKKNL